MLKRRVTDAVKDARTILASIPIYAQQLCNEKGVVVKFDAFAPTAMTDGQTITLPALPLPNKAADVEVCSQLADLVQVFIPHEVGHIRYTTFGEMRKIDTELGRSLLNAIEDPRQELVLIQHLPGTRRQLDRGCERLATMGFFDAIKADESPAEVLTMYVLYYLRGHLREQDLMLDLAEATRPAAVEVFGENFVNRLDVLLATDGMRMQSTADAGRLTKAILQAVKEAEAEHKPQPQPSQAKAGDSAPDSGSDSGQTGSDPNGADADKDGGQESGGARKDGDDGKDKGSDAAGQADSGDDAGDSAESPNGTGAGAGKDNPFSKAIEEGAKGCKDLGAVLAEAIEQTKQGVDQRQLPKIRDVVRSVKAEESRMQPEGQALDPMAASMASRALKTRLRSQLQTQTLSRSYDSVRGNRLAARKIHRTSQYDRRLFVHQDDQKGVETAVYLLADTSGSMSGPRIRMLNDALYAVADAMHSLSGVKVGAGAFPGNRTVLPMGSNPRGALTRMNLDTGGGTPMGEAMFWAGRQLSRRSEPRKILMVLTDGEPESVPDVLGAIAALEGMGVEVFGVGIQHPGVRRLFENLCVVSDLSELPKAMLDMLKASLMKPQRIAA